MSLKTGRLTKDEKQQILLLSQTFSAQEIADKLNRRLVNIEKFLEENKPLSPQEQQEDDERLLKTLRGKTYWHSAKEHFSEKEMKLFELEWIELFKQFKEDVEYSEELQIVNLIRLNLLINRNLYERNMCRNDLDDLNRQKKEFVEKNGPGPIYPDPHLIAEYAQLETLTRTLEASFNSRMSELKLLMDKQGTYQKEMKATREQRVAAILNSKKDWVRLMKDLKDEKIRKKEGRELELLNLATQKEKEKLMEFHSYSDNTLDRPLLNSESV